MADTRRFADRSSAGKQLGEELKKQGIDADIVLAIPRGGLPIGRAVADTVSIPLDIVVASKIGAPGNPEYAIGAVASDGSVWRNEEAIRLTGTDETYFDRECERETANAREKAERYRKGRSPPDLTGKTVAVVDDGVATGSTAKACLTYLDTTDAERLILAVPVGAQETITQLAELADEVLCLMTPRNFRGVGQFYEDFGQVTDEEAMAYLNNAR